MSNLMKGQPITLYVRSMHKLFKATAIFDNDEEANQHMSKTGNDEGVIAVIGSHVILANLRDTGVKIEPTQ